MMQWSISVIQESQVFITTPIQEHLHSLARPFHFTVGLGISLRRDSVLKLPVSGKVGELA